MTDAERIPVDQSGAREDATETAVARSAVAGYLGTFGARAPAHFVERQKGITLDGDDHYLDLLFFHRRMQRLVAIELKLGDFKAAAFNDGFDGRCSW